MTRVKEIHTKDMCRIKHSIPVRFRSIIRLEDEVFLIIFPQLEQVITLPG